MACFERIVHRRSTTGGLRCWWDKAAQYIGPFLFLVGITAMLLHVNVTVMCSVNENNANSNSTSDHSTLPNEAYVNTQCSANLGFPTKSFSGILIFLAMLLALIGNFWFRLPIVKNKMKVFLDRTDGPMKSSRTFEEMQRIESDPEAVPEAELYDEIKRQHNDLWEYREFLEKERSLGRFYLTKSIVQLAIAIMALVFSLFFASWPPMYRPLFPCVLAEFKAEYFCTRTLGTWITIINVIYALAALSYIAILIVGLIWYYREGRKPYGLTGKVRKEVGSQNDQVTINMEEEDNEAFERGIEEFRPREPPDGGAEEISTMRDEDVIEHHRELEVPRGSGVEAREQIANEQGGENDSLLVEEGNRPVEKRESIEEVDQFHGDAAFLMRLLKRSSLNGPEKIPRLMSRPWKEKLEGLVYDPGKISIHHETVCDDTVTIQLQWDGPIKGEYTRFIFTVKKRIEETFVNDDHVQVIKRAKKKKVPTATLR